MKKLVRSLLFALTICFMAGCMTLPVSSSPKEPGIGERSNLGITESVEPEVTDAPEPTEETEVTEVPEATATLVPTETPEPTATPKPTATTKPTATPAPTATLKPTATPKPTPTRAPVIDRNVVERDAYAVNGKNGKIHRTGDCPATGTGENAMTNPVYFPTYEEAEAYSIKIKKNLDKRKCGNCWR